MRRISIVLGVVNSKRGRKKRGEKKNTGSTKRVCIR
jgi:hypothetical protein